MSKFNCFSALVGRKKNKGDKSSSKTDAYYKKLETLEVRIESIENSSETGQPKSISISVPVPLGSSRCNAKVMSHESPVQGKATKVDVHEENDQSKSEKMELYGFLGKKVTDPNKAESLVRRVDEWVKELAAKPPLPVDDDDDNTDGGIVFPQSPNTGRSSGTCTSNLAQHSNMNLSEEILYANSYIQSLSSSSSVANIVGIGLKVIPRLSGFCSLHSVNLSGNSIVHITSVSLPKGVRTLNLSRNNISTIEGFRELSRLRVLDVSYNRISRIGQGLSNCTLIKELYLAGNKISEVEGLHRLLKLCVLDLSFNKITTTKALGQLVANYNSQLALNLLANPIQRNISDNQTWKAIHSLLPKLAYLNKQPINPQKAREVGTEGIAKAAFGNNGWSSGRKAVKKVSGGQKNRHRTRSRTRQQ